MPEPGSLEVRAAALAGTGDGAVPGRDGWFLGDGAEITVRAKKPVATRAVRVDTKECMVWDGMWCLNYSLAVRRCTFVLRKESSERSTFKGK